jgi:hypothetical protein
MAFMRLGRLVFQSVERGVSFSHRRVLLVGIDAIVGPPAQRNCQLKLPGDHQHASRYSVSAVCVAGLSLTYARSLIIRAISVAVFGSPVIKIHTEWEHRLKEMTAAP